MRQAFNRYKPGRVEGDPYIADEKLAVAVNTALAAQQPLLVMGEPGTGKTALASSIARRLGGGLPLLEFHTRSDHQAKDLVYRYEAMQRFFDAQKGYAAASGHAKYLRAGPLGEALESMQQRVVLIDEIDKASRDFPNGLLQVLEEREFRIDETGDWIRPPDGAPKPIVVVTSNSERDLPDAFLRRCVFYEIRFPADELLVDIVNQHVREVATAMVKNAVARFVKIRGRTGLKKAPATSELITWVKVLRDAGLLEEVLTAPIDDLMPGVLLKTKSDYAAVVGKRE